MPSLKIVFSAVALLIIGPVAGYTQTTNAPLAFYVVSEQKIDGGRFINTSHFPNLGYIADKADLSVTNLLAVLPTRRPPFKVTVDANGSQVANPIPSITVQLTPADAKEFNALTRKAVGKKLLIMSGERLLLAPNVVEPVEGSSIPIEFVNADELKKAESELKKLLRDGIGAQQIETRRRPPDRGIY